MSRPPRLHTVRGVTRTLPEWAAVLRISRPALSMRVRDHGSVAAAVALGPKRAPWLRRRFYRRPPIRPGHRYGRLTVLRASGARDYEGVWWFCRCKCGREVEVSARRLRRHAKPTRSCGCLVRDAHAARMASLARARFGHLVVETLRPKAGRTRAWGCRCDCGRARDVATHVLRQGRAVTCGDRACPYSFRHARHRCAVCAPFAAPKPAAKGGSHGRRSVGDGAVGDPGGGAVAPPILAGA